MIPVIMFLIISAFLSLIMKIRELLDKYNKLTERVSETLRLSIIISITFWLISFSAFIGPPFLKSMDYNVTDIDYTITAFDATNCVLSSLLVVVIAYLFYKLPRK